MSRSENIGKGNNCRQI